MSHALAHLLRQETPIFWQEETEETVYLQEKPALLLSAFVEME